eukprot:scaffold1706_cov116-Cylindrotheca_fusiformis.AAC.11
MAARADSESNRAITVAGPHDVLLGRGGGTNNHPGNKNFRELVNEHKRRYLACNKVDKPKVARDVIAIWRGLNPPGRFLQKSKDSPDVFEEVSEKKAREKASQCLRERTADVLPYLNQYHQEQDQYTENGVGAVQRRIQMTGESSSSHLAGAEIPDRQASSLGLRPQHVASLTSKSQHSQQSMGHHTTAAPPTSQNSSMQQLYKNQQQGLQATFSSNSAQKTHQDAIQMAHQQALQERHMLEQQRHMLMQHQLAMQKQMLHNTIVAQQLMLQQNGLAMAQMSSPMASPTSRRQSLSTGFSQININQNRVSLSPHTPQSGMHNRYGPGHMMTNSIPGPPLEGPATTESYEAMPSPMKSSGEIPSPTFSNSRNTKASDGSTGSGISPIPLVATAKPPPARLSSRGSKKSQKVPSIIDTTSSQEEAGMFMNLPLTDSIHTLKQDNTSSNINTNKEEDLNTKMSRVGDSAAPSFEDYTTGLNDDEDDQTFDDPNLFFDDDSSEELLKDHSNFHDSLGSVGFSDSSLTRKKKSTAIRRSSKSSMAMSLGTSSLMSLSAMDYSTDLSREQKMSANRSLGSSRSIMSELTDCEQHQHDHPELRNSR